MVKCAIFDIVDNVSPGISWLASLDLLVSRRTKTYFMLAPWMSGIYFYSFSSFILMSGSFFQYFFFIILRASIDGDGDGDISKEEFVKNAMGSKFINDILNKPSN